MVSDEMRWRQPVSPEGPGRLEILRRRHVIRKAVRDYLDGQGYIEIDAPLLVRGTTPDPAVEAFRAGDRYLVTSTEYQMKRLAVGGFERLYSLTQNFRSGDVTSGPLRNPEFTMLEWGRTGSGMDAIEADTEGFTLAAMEALGLEGTIVYQGRRIDMRPPWRRISVAEAITGVTGYAFTVFDVDNCRGALQAVGVTIQAEWAQDRDFLFSLLMTHIQPRLGEDRPVFIRDWPFYETTSAQARADGITADRSELLIAGIEIADGFAALADAEIQMHLFNQAQAKREALGQPRVELDFEYIRAMQESSLFGAGMALGFDRLVMLLTDQPHIRNVLAFEWDEL